MRRLLLLLLFVSLASAASCTADIVNIVFSQQGQLLVAVIMLSVVGVAVLYGIGSFMNKPEYLVQSKDEFYHLLFSILLLVSFGGILAVGCLFSDTLIQTGAQSLGVKDACFASGGSAMAISLCSLNSIQADVDNFIYFSTRTQLQYLRDAGFAYSAGDIIRGSTKTTSIEAYKRVYANELDMISNTYVFPARITITMQRIFLKLVDESIINWVLPIAFVFRFFPPFRQMGNILIAISLAFYVVLPFFMVFNFLMYSSVADQCQNDVSIQNIMQDKPLVSELGLPVCGATSMWFVVKVLPVAFFLPNLSIALMITFIAGVNKALRVVG